MIETNIRRASTAVLTAGLLIAIPLVHTQYAQRQGASLSERLGFAATEKILIINVDDVAGSHAANVAAIDVLENGLATSGTIMVPCPWFPEIAAYAKANPERDFGLHLTHTSEWKTYKWGPVASRSDVPGLVDPQGYLWPDIMNVYRHSTPEQAYIEARRKSESAGCGAST